MKKLIALTVAVFVSVSMFANNNNPNETVQQKLRKEIIALLESPQFEVENSDIIANIEFTLNTKNEIVVLNVESDEDMIAYYVKSRLNYQKVNFDGSKRGNINFKMTLKVVKPKA